MSILSRRLIVLLRVAVLLAWTVAPRLVLSQVCNPTCPGDNAVFQGTAQQASHAFIDASQLAGTNNQTDICNKINAALAQLFQAHTQTPAGVSIYGNEGVIDARGVTNLDCANSSSPINPWNGFYYYPTTANPPPDNTVLLPAGIIQVSVPWTLPARTRLIGQGSCAGTNCSNPASTTLTTIQACSSSTSGCNGLTFPAGPIIYMGGMQGGYSACPVSQCPGGTTYGVNCNGVSIEHLRLDGNNIAGGIENDYSQELSFVSDVAMVNVNGTGLALTSTTGGTYVHDASNSGPYSNLYISGTGQCVNIKGTQGTRGLHGLSCVSASVAQQAAAVFIDGANNTIEDVSISAASGPGFTDGVLIGSQALSGGATANSNLLFNIIGDTNIQNLIHFCGIASNGNCPTNANGSTLPTDVTVVGATRGSGGVSVATIEDDLTGSPSLEITDTHVGIYLFGEPITEGSAPGTQIGYSKFTTSESVPTWLVGSSSSGPHNPCPAQGTLYSDTGSSSGTLWGCVGNNNWASIK